LRIRRRLLKVTVVATANIWRSLLKVLGRLLKVWRRLLKVWRSLVKVKVIYANNWSFILRLQGVVYFLHIIISFVFRALPGVHY